MSADLFPLIPHHNTGAGLADRECYIITQAAPDLPGAWQVQYDEDDHGHGSIALVPGRDDHGHETPVFLIWREGGRLHLGIGQGDFYAGLGIHADVEALVRAVRRTLDGARVVDQWVSCELDPLVVAARSDDRPDVHPRGGPTSTRRAPASPAPTR